MGNPDALGKPLFELMEIMMGTVQGLSVKRDHSKKIEGVVLEHRSVIEGLDEEVLSFGKVPLRKIGIGTGEGLSGFRVGYNRVCQPEKVEQEGKYLLHKIM